MRLKITHRTEYAYDAPVAYALQRVRLVPLHNDLQAIGQRAELSVSRGNGDGQSRHAIESGYPVGNSGRPSTHWPIIQTEVPPRANED